MPQKKNKISEAAAIEAAFHILKSEGLLFPQTTEDITILEEETGVFPRTNLSAKDVLRFSDGLEKCSAFVSDSDVREISELIRNELGVAARNGLTIPAELWLIMSADRSAAENRRNSNV